jgi:hypothetical protein
MKIAKYLFIILFVVGALVIGLNFDKFAALLRTSSEEDSNSAQETNSIDVVKNDSETLEDQITSNNNSSLKEDLASDGQITHDEALDLIQEMFSVEGVTFESARFIDQNDYKFLLSVLAYTENATTSINEWWTVDRTSGEIAEYDSDVLSEE